jgi:hypothetical protein
MWWSLEIAEAKGHAQQCRCSVPCAGHRHTASEPPLSDILVVAETSCDSRFRYPSVCCCIFPHFLDKIRIAKCFTKKSKEFWCEVMFDNEHTFFSWTHKSSYLHSFCATGVNSGLATRVTLTPVSRGNWGSVTRGWACFRFNFLTAVPDFCCRVEALYRAGCVWATHAGDFDFMNICM